MNNQNHHVNNFLNTSFYLIFYSFLLIFAGTRGEFIGRDTDEYYKIFEVIAIDGSWFQVEYYEPLYVFINSVFYKMGFSVQSLIFFTVVLAITPVFILFNKISPNKNLSIILYFSIFGYFMVFNVIRQTIAMGFFAWFIYFFYAKSYKWAWFFALISIGFHYTALVAILALVLVRLFSPNVFFILYFISLFFLFIPSISGVFLNLLFGKLLFLVSDKYIAYLSVGGESKIIALKDIISQVIFGLSFYFYFYGSNYKKINYFHIAFLCSMISVLLSNFFYHIQYFERFSSYFFMFNAVSVVLFISTVKKGEQRIIVSSVIALLAVILSIRSLTNAYNLIIPYNSWLF